MTSKRSRLEIYLDVLKAIERGNEKRTRIMYCTNVSWNPLMRVLSALKKQGFLLGVVTDTSGCRGDPLRSPWAGARPAPTICRGSSSIERH